jgi:hypothetical protein
MDRARFANLLLWSWSNAVGPMLLRPISLALFALVHCQPAAHTFVARTTRPCPAPPRAPIVQPSPARTNTLVLEPVVANDPSRWQVRLSAPSPSVRVRLRTLRGNQERCDNTLERQSPDGRWWCIPARSAIGGTDLILDAAHPTRTFDLVTALAFRQSATRPRDEERPLPPGRYRLRIDTQIDDGPWRPIERVFVAQSEARANIDALIGRMVTAITTDCRPAPPYVADALAAAASPAQLEPLLSLDRGRTDDRAELFVSLAVLPEVQALLRERLFHRTTGFVAATAILRQKHLFDATAVAQAESTLARELPGTSDPGVTAIFAVNRSSWSSGIIAALAARIDRTTDLVELGHWDMAFTCVDRRIEPLGLGELVRALRRAAARVRRTSPDLQRTLLRRANELEGRIRAERRSLDLALSVARGRRSPPPSPNISRGCGFGFGTSRRDGPQCSPDPWPTISEVVFPPTTIVLDDPVTEQDARAQNRRNPSPP